MANKDKDKKKKTNAKTKKYQTSTLQLLQISSNNAQIVWQHFKADTPVSDNSLAYT